MRNPQAFAEVCKGRDKFSLHVRIRQTIRTRFAFQESPSYKPLNYKTLDLQIPKVCIQSLSLALAMSLVGCRVLQ